MKEAYFELVMLLERLHRLFLELVKIELGRLGVKDLNNIQAMILYNIGKNQLTVGEISNRGYYLGSNVSYNLKKMIDNQYIVQQQSQHDKRSNQIKLAPKGLKLLEKIDVSLQKQVDSLQLVTFTDGALPELLNRGRQLESFWSQSLVTEMRF